MDQDDLSKLKKVLRYDCDTGQFTWLVTTGKAIKGNAAGNLDADGYLRIKFGGKKHYAHRLAWFFMTGEMPNQLIDHVNGVRSDNKFSNLREATPGQNLGNSKASWSSSGLRGVSWHRKTGTWQAQIQIKGKNKHLGHFQRAEDAHAAYVKASKRHHGVFCPFTGNDTPFSQ